MKRIILLAAFLCFAPDAPAQTPGAGFGVSKVDASALIEFIRSEITPEFYFVADELRSEFPLLTFARLSYCAGILSIPRKIEFVDLFRNDRS